MDKIYHGIHSFSTSDGEEFELIIVLTINETSIKISYQLNIDNKKLTFNDDKGVLKYINGLGGMIRNKKKKPLLIEKL